MVAPLLLFAQGDKEHSIEGKASFYAKKFQGRKTANGEIFSNYDLTAAHKTLPFNTYVNVVNRINNYNVIVRINDRGPFVKNRVIDLTESGARRIGGYHRGLVPVHLKVLDIIHLTPQLDSTFHAGPVTDCLGNVTSLEGITISLWSTHDLLHAIYVANDLYLKDDVKQVLIGKKMMDDKMYYHVLLSNHPDKETALKVKEVYEEQGFMKATFFEL